MSAAPASKAHVIPISHEPVQSVRSLPPAQTASAALPTDRLGRRLQSLRISVTDRCNFRCPYCMPRDRYGSAHRFLPHEALLSFEEIARAAAAAAALGVRKLRLTGGEPLLRKDLPALVEQLAAIRTPEGRPLTLALTTNGALLARHAPSLRAAGLQRVTVSLDALDPVVFARMSDSTFPVEDVLAGIDAALAAGLGPVKVNMVVQKGANDDQVLPMVRRFRGTGIELRFIEFMDVGQSNRWQLDRVLPSQALREVISEHWPLLPATSARQDDTATRWVFADGAGSVGFISSVTQPFCGDCTRLRLSTDGRLYTCLFATQGHDLRALLRDPSVSETELRQRMAALWQARDDRYSELRQPGAPAGPLAKVEMGYIGG